MTLVGVNLKIDEKIWEQFGEKTKEKYNRERGVVSMEVEMAIRDWMEKGMQPCPKRQYTKTSKTGGGGTFDQNAKKISISKNKKVDALTEHITNLGKNHIGLGSLKKEISAVTGTSNTGTINKYLHILENMNIIKSEGVNSWLINKEWGMV